MAIGVRGMAGVIVEPLVGLEINPKAEHATALHLNMAEKTVQEFQQIRQPVKSRSVQLVSLSYTSFVAVCFSKA